MRAPRLSSSAFVVEAASCCHSGQGMCISRHCPSRGALCLLGLVSSGSPAGAPRCIRVLLVLEIVWNGLCKAKKSEGPGSEHDSEELVAFSACVQPFTST